MQISEQLLACPCRSECVDPTAERHTLDGGEQESGIVVLEWQMRSAISLLLLLLLLLLCSIICLIMIMYIMHSV